MTRTGKTRGQALIMVTLSLIAMCGMMGLAVDVGWGYFVKKSAQRAADAAALAGVEQALAQVGQASQFVCGTGITCPTATQCPSSPTNPPANEFDSACLYAKQNGFSVGSNTNQNVIIDANTTKPIPTAPGINADYWVTARVSQQIPQLFSNVLQFPWMQTSARATAAVVASPVPGSIYLINRENDAGPSGTGTDLSMQGGGSITSTGGVYMASTSSGSPNYAGHLGGSSSITSAYVGLRGTGSIDNTSNVSPSPQNGLPDQSNFKDPMRGKGQPPAPTSVEAPAPATACSGTLCGGPVYDKSSKSAGLINGSSGCVTVGPGTYYAADKNGKATGDVINLTGCVNFTNTNGFGSYVFLGGLNVSGPGSVVTLAPGRYILAGVQGSQNSVYSQSNGVTIQDQTPLNGSGQMVANTDAGEIMVFTDANYPSLYIPPAVSSISSTLVYGSVSVQMGNTSASQFNLHGLNAANGSLPDNLKPFAPTVLWQDQGNSPVKYDSNGNIDLSCGGTLDSPCANTNSEVTTKGKNPSVDMALQATPGLHLYGVLYQPRGGALTMQGSGSVTTPLVIISGSLTMGGSPTVLQPLTNGGPIRRMAALVE